MATLESTNVSTLDSKVASLNTQDSDDKDAVNADIASLATLESTNISTLDSQVSSLNTQDSDDKDEVNADIASLATLVSTNDVYADNVITPSGDSSIEIDYSSAGFTTEPAVMGTLRSSDSSDPVIAIQISGAPSTDAAMFVFADDIPNGNYTIDVLASI